MKFKLFILALFVLCFASQSIGADLGVCVSYSDDGLCSEFVVLNGLVSLDSSSFDWDFFEVLVSGLVTLYVTGLSIGVCLAWIKKTPRVF
jgi:hypothetical protein